MLLLRMRSTYVASIRFDSGLEWSEMYRMQLDHARLDLMSFEIWSRVFWPIAWNLRKTQRKSKQAIHVDESDMELLIFMYI